MNSKKLEKARNLFLSEILVLLFKSSNVTQRILFSTKTDLREEKQKKKKRKRFDTKFLFANRFQGLIDSFALK